VTPDVDHHVGHEGQGRAAGEQDVEQVVGHGLPQAVQEVMAGFADHGHRYVQHDAYAAAGARLVPPAKPANSARTPETRWMML
jgi:hypothetical protein